MPLVGFEPTISAGERAQTYALDRAATGTGIVSCVPKQNYFAIFTVQYNLQIWPWAADWAWWNDNV